MRYFIGIDGGATKTEAVVCDESGVMLGEGIAGPSNISSLSEEGVKSNIAGCCDTALKAAGLTRGDVTALYGGFAGGITYAEQISAILHGLFGGASIRNAGDGVNVLSCGLLERDGAGVISGTGSTCFVRRGERLIQIGGNGFLIDKLGSGFDIGRDMLNAILKEWDERGEKTLLTELYIEKFGITVADDLEHVYAKGVSFIASLAPVVFKAERDGDKIAGEIIFANMGAIAELIDAAAHHFSDEELPFTAALGGGIFTNPAAMKALSTQIKSSVKLFPLPCPPVFGAAVEAMRDVGLFATEETRDNFVRTYKRL